MTNVESGHNCGTSRHAMPDLSAYCRASLEYPRQKPYLSQVRHHQLFPQKARSALLSTNCRNRRLSVVVGSAVGLAEVIAMERAARIPPRHRASYLAAARRSAGMAAVLLLAGCHAGRSAIAVLGMLLVGGLLEALVAELAWRRYARRAAEWERLARDLHAAGDWYMVDAAEARTQARINANMLPTKRRARYLTRARRAAGLTLALALGAGCERSTEPEYFRDQRTGLCFATLQFGWASPGLWAEPATSWVPCTGAVLDLLPLEVAGAPRDDRRRVPADAEAGR